MGSPVALTSTGAACACLLAAPLRQGLVPQRASLRHADGRRSPLRVEGLRTRPELWVVVQGAHGHLQHGTGGDALPQHLAVPRRLPCEPAGTETAASVWTGGGVDRWGCGPEVRRGMRQGTGDPASSQGPRMVTKRPPHQPPVPGPVRWAGSHPSPHPPLCTRPWGAQMPWRFPAGLWTLPAPPHPPHTHPPAFPPVSLSAARKAPPCRGRSSRQGPETI